MTRVKFCGLRREEDIEAANETMPDFAGFIIDYPRSRRSISEKRAIELEKRLSDRIRSVAVFVDQPAELVADFMNSTDFDLAQLHGSEDYEYIDKLKRLTAKPFIKAYIINNRDVLEEAIYSPAPLILLDSGRGSGCSFDWSLLKDVHRDYFLAGGISSTTIRTVLSELHPYAVDLSSAIESDGFKDMKKMKEIIQIMKANRSYFGDYGGQFVPETLMNALNELESAYMHYKDNQEFRAELSELLNSYAGRPSRLYYAKRMSEKLGGAKIYLKREDLNHTGAHKINNVLGQALLAKRMGKTRLIAETGAGQHGVATATAAALLGMECEIYMGKEDTERQALNVYRMKLLGAKVHPVTTGTATLKDAVSEAFREWTSRIDDTHYLVGSAMGPHPFPMIVRDFQSVISEEMKAQILEAEGRLPDAVIACVGGGSNAIGSFYNFIDDKNVRLIGAEAAGRGIDTDETAATISTGKDGIFHGMKSLFCQDKYGQIAPVYSISAGLDYPGIGPEHAYLHSIGRAEYTAITDDEAVDAFEFLSRTEGIIPAIESAHAVAEAMKLAPAMPKESIIIVTLSGRGDKDVAAIARYRGEMIYE